MYKIIYSKQAVNDLKKLKCYEPIAFKKVLRMLNELLEHPLTGIGHPEQLKGSPHGRWSRQITKKHRLVYRVFEQEVYVDVLAAYGHYDDK